MDLVRLKDRTADRQIAVAATRDNHRPDNLLRLHRAVTGSLLLVLGLLLLLTNTARAAKWHTCPEPPSKVYPSIRGATISRFIHPGHDLTIVLNERETAAQSFSLEPDGNSISITFRSLFGEDITLPDRSATAAGPSVLAFSFPDTESEVGRVLAGPVEIRVHTDGRLTAHIAPSNLLALPPANDVTPIVLGDSPDQVVWASLSGDGSLWVPASFQGEPMAMPSCPGSFIFPLFVQVAAAEVVGAPDGSLNPLDRIRGVACYLGDMIIRDQSYYGMLLSSNLRLVHVGDSLGVSLCRINDSIDLVLRVKGDRSWIGSRRSPLPSVARDSSPVPLRLIATNEIPRSESALRRPHTTNAVDSFGNECAPAPQSSQGGRSRSK
jgi:hypothetical protein